MPLALPVRLYSATADSTLHWQVQWHTLSNSPTQPIIRIVDGRPNCGAYRSQQGSVNRWIHRGIGDCVSQVFDKETVRRFVRDRLRDCDNGRNHAFMSGQPHSTHKIFLSLLDIDATLTHLCPCSIREESLDRRKRCQQQAQGRLTAERGEQGTRYGFSNAAGGTRRGH